MSPVSTRLRRTSLSHVALSSPDVDAMAQFYETVMGMVRHPSEGAVLLGWGNGHHVLELSDGPVGLDHFAFEIGDAGGPDSLAERLRQSEVEVEALPEAAGYRVRDPEGNAVHFHGRISRSGEGCGGAGFRPVRVQHVTLGTREMKPMVDFYSSIGFSVTDRMEDSFTWLRSNVEHHSLAIVGVGRSVLDHYSYDLESWADFKTWADRLTDLGIPVTWGPGRHGPGNNLFLFFDDPDGHHIELSAEMEKFFDDRVRYETRIWERSSRTVNLWGGQVPRWRNTGEEG